jgi:hypothetical protein
MLAAGELKVPITHVIGKNDDDVRCLSLNAKTKEKAKDCPY